MRGDARDHGDDDPGDGIVEDRRGEDELAQIAPHRADVDQHHGHDLHRGDRQRRAEEQRRDQPVLVHRNGAARQGIGQRHAQRERHGDAGDRGGDDRALAAPHQGQVGFHAGQQEKQKDADLGDRIDHRLQGLVVGENKLPSLGPQQAEYRGTEHDTRDQLPKQGGLTESIHHLAQQASGEQQQDQLGRKNRQSMVGFQAVPPTRIPSGEARQ